MKKMWKNGLCMILFVLFGVTLFSLADKPVEAAEEKKVMTLCLTDEDGYVTELDLYQEIDSNGEVDFSFEDTHVYILVHGRDTMKLKLSVKDVDTSVLFPEYMEYEEEITISKESGMSHMFRFMYQVDGEYNTDFDTFVVCGYDIDLHIANLLISASSKGFKPSKNNYMLIRSNVVADTSSVYGQTNLRVRVLNKSGKYVYQKTLKNISSGGCLDLTWNGKATKNNTAKVAAKKYVKKTGTYKVEVALIFKADSGRQVVVSKRKSFKIKNSAPSGTKGLAKAKKIIQYTGTASIDYMAEDMIKKAGVKSSMSDDQKVKKIYSYMTRKFKHDNGQKKKTYYNLEKLQKKIVKYGTNAEKKLESGKLVYNYYGDYAVQRSMVQRSGVCDYHAAIFKILLNHVGIEAGVCNGYYINRNGTYAPHAWNYAIVNGKTYYYDVDIEIQNYGKGQGNYYWYKKTYKQAKKNHAFY